MSNISIKTLPCPSDEQQSLLARSESLHRQLRPSIPGDYAAYMARMFAEGARMAVLFDGDVARAIGVSRRHHTTFQGLRFYVDDLVADEAHRGQGYGGRMIDWLEATAREEGCSVFALDSGVHRDRAHKFYFTKGLAIRSFSFSKLLS